MKDLSREIDSMENLFINNKDRKNFSHLNKNISRRNILKKNNYSLYPISSPCKFVKSFKLDFCRDGIKCAENEFNIYCNDENVFGMVVTTRDTRYPILKHQPQIDIATYMFNDDDLVLINRFDYRKQQKFELETLHKNNYSIFTGEEKNLYEKHFTDRIYKKNPVVFTPHLHFNTGKQSTCLKSQDSAAAISLGKLKKYLLSLQLCKDDTQPILKYDLGMPFKIFRLDNYEYEGKMLQNLRLAIKDNHDENIKKFMEGLLPTFDHSNLGEITKTSGILIDIKNTEKFIENNSELIEVIHPLVKGFVEEVTGLGCDNKTNANAKIII